MSHKLDNITADVMSHHKGLINGKKWANNCKVYNPVNDRQKHKIIELSYFKRTL